MPKFSPLGGPVSEILADVTFVTDGRTHTHTNTLTARIIYIDSNESVGLYYKIAHLPLNSVNIYPAKFIFVPKFIDIAFDN